MNIIDRIQKSLHDKLPFVVYRKPNEATTSGFFQENDVLYKTKNYQEKGFVFAPFDDKNNTVLIPDEFSCFVEEEVPLEENISFNTNFNIDETAKDFHISIVNRGIKAIEEDRFKKVVLSRRETVAHQNENVVAIFKKLLKSYANAYVYVWSHPKVGLWMGATPETLIKVQQGFFETMSLAGTQLYVNTKAVQWEAKELHEQQLVTDYVLQKLKQVSNSVEASEVTTIKAGNLLHLKTTIKGKHHNNTAKLIEILHPTPAVCGFPKEESKEFILTHEGYDRSFYTGFLGEVNMPNSELFVNLRCMEIKEEAAYIYIGGGITIASNAEKEWSETVAKSKTMKRVL